jgi:hypothetical protein
MDKEVLAINLDPTELNAKAWAKAMHAITSRENFIIR